MRSFLLWNFRQVYRASRWTRTRFTPAGRYLLSFTLLVGVLGVDIRQSQFYQLFALLASILLIALLTSRWARPNTRQLEVRRQLPRFGTVNEPLSYRVRIENSSAGMQPSLLFQDELRKPPIDRETFSRLNPEWNIRRNWFDRVVGYPRFVSTIHQLMGAFLPEIRVPDVAPGGYVDLKIETLPVRRGFIHFTSANLSATEPMGLFKGYRRTDLPDRLLILPRRYPVSPLGLTGNRCYQQGGVTQSSQVGDSMEFAGIREYRPGDPPKHLHWKSWAKTGSPYVKQYQDEYFVRHALILDSFMPIGDQLLFEEAVSIAASFASAEHGQDDLLDLVFAGDQVHLVTAGRGLAGTEQLLEILACLEPKPPAGFSELARAVMNHAATLSNGICVFLQWDEQRKELVKNLLALGLPLLVLVVRNPGDTEALDPGPMSSRPDRFHAVPLGEASECLARV